MLSWGCCQFLSNNSVEFYKISRVTDGFFNYCFFFFLIRSVEHLQIQFVLKLLRYSYGLGDFLMFEFCLFQGEKKWESSYSWSKILFLCALGEFRGIEWVCVAVCFLKLTSALYQHTANSVLWVMRRATKSRMKIPLEAVLLLSFKSRAWFLQKTITLMLEPLLLLPFERQNTDLIWDVSIK